jgi:hypothetical protein
MNPPASGKPDTEPPGAFEKARGGSQPHPSHHRPSSKRPYHRRLYSPSDLNSDGQRFAGANSRS